MTTGILLVGGFGTRLKPLTNKTPKPMLPVAGIPVTEHQIIAAKKAGISTLILATAYLSEVFSPYFGDGQKWGIKLRYAIEKEPLGTGGAIRNASELIDDNRPVVIFNGDVLSGHSISKQLEFHQEKEADVTLHLIEVDDARAFGCVPTNEEGRVTAFLEKMEKPVTRAINAGCYIFQRSVIDSIPVDTVVSVERETFPALVAANRPLYGYLEQAYWLDVGTPAALFQGSRDSITGDFIVMPGAEIDPSARLSGGTSIGSDCVIGARAHLNNCIVSQGAIIKEGAILDSCFIAPGTKVGSNEKYSSMYLSNIEKSPLSL